MTEQLTMKKVKGPAAPAAWPVWPAAALVLATRLAPRAARRARTRGAGQLGRAGQEHQRPAERLGVGQPRTARGLTKVDILPAAARAYIHSKVVSRAEP